MASAQQRPPNRRGPSGAWSRLKAAPTDPLHAYGLPSKGETRLNDVKAQENFYNKIVERYMKFCGASGGGEELDKQFAALSFQNTPLIPGSKPLRLPLPTVKEDTATALPRLPLPTATREEALPPSPELQLIISSMRKLREAIVATRRTDTFAQRAYIFLIRACILTYHWESYSPALLYLLHTIHPETPLPPHELHEFANYLVLDLACRQNLLHNAYLAKRTFNVHDRRICAVLKAIVGDNWTAFWRLRRRVDGYQRCVMRFAEDGVRLHALKCLGTSYFSAERTFIERATERTWNQLVEGNVGWELGGDGTVIIRRVKKR